MVKERGKISYWDPLPARSSFKMKGEKVCLKESTIREIIPQEERGMGHILQAEGICCQLNCAVRNGEGVSLGRRGIITAGASGRIRGWRACAHVVLVQPLSHVWPFAAPWTAARQAALSSTISRVPSESCPLDRWCYLTISFSFGPQSFPASGSVSVNQLFASGGQSIGASALASVLSMNIWSWFL